MFPCQVGHEATTRTFFETNYLYGVLGIELSCSSSKWAVTGATHPTPDETTSWHLKMGSIATDSTITDGVFRDTIDSTLRLEGVKPYCLAEGRYWTSIDDIYWYGNGVLLGHWSGVIEASPIVPAPSAMPIFGTWIEISAGVTAFLGEPTGAILPSASRVRASSTAKCGMRFYRDGVWSSPSVQFPPIFYAHGGSNLIDLGGIVAAGNCWNGVLTCEGDSLWNYDLDGTWTTYDSYKRTVHSVGKSGTAYLYPDWNKGVVRMNDDYAATVFRGGFPSVTARATNIDVVNHGYTTPPPWRFIESRTILSTQSQFLATVGPSHHIIEDPLSQPVLSGMSLGASEQEFSITNDYIVPHGTHTAPWTGYTPPSGSPAPVTTTIKNGGTYFVFPDLVTPGTGPNAMLNYLTHRAPLITYGNSWANPAWSYVYYQPRDLAPPSVAWPLDGFYASPKLYWLPLKQQYLWNPNLPVGERPKYRTHNISNGGTQNLLAALMEGQVYGQSTNWWGISRFEAQDLGIVNPATLDSSSSGNWTLTNCTAVFTGTRIELTSTGPTTFKAEYAVNRNSYPRWLAQLAREISIGWDSANVVSVLAELVYVDGTYETLGTTVGSHAKPGKVASKYAGTWSQDMGAGFTSDTGADNDLTLGMSVTSMADATLVEAFQLPRSKTITKLRFTVVVTSAALPAKLTYPSFTAATEQPLAIPETSTTAAIVTTNGPMVRYGQDGFYNRGSDAFSAPPLLLDVTQCPTALDALCARRLMFEGKDVENGLDTEINTIYDNNETAGVRKQAARYKDADGNIFIDSHSFVVQGRKVGATKPVLCIVSSLRELPPHAMFPGNARDGNFQVIAGSYDCKTYAYDSADFRIISDAHGETALFTPGGVQLSINSPALPGWQQARYRLVTDGSEPTTYKIKRNGVTYGKVRPYHGWSCVLDMNPDINPDSGGGGVWSDQTPDGRYLVAFVTGTADVRFRRAPHSIAPGNTWDSDQVVTSYGDVRRVSFVVEFVSQRVVMLITREVTAGNFTIWRGYSDDFGTTFGSFTNVAVGKGAFIGAGALGSILEVRFVFDSGTSGPGTLVGQYRGPGDTAYSGDFTLTDGTSTLHVKDEKSWGNPVHMKDTVGRWNIAFVVNGETDMSHWFSTDDGRTWQRVV
jgi:hypothetical protein